MGFTRSSGASHLTRRSVQKKARSRRLNLAHTIRESHERLRVRRNDSQRAAAWTLSQNLQVALLARLPGARFRRCHTCAEEEDRRKEKRV